MTDTQTNCSAHGRSSTQMVDTDARGPLRHIPGEVGTWIFIFGDMGVFAILFCVFLHARQSDPAAFAADQTTLNANLGAFNTVLLLISSLFVVLAMRAVRSGAQGMWASCFIAAAFLCGGGFLVVKIFEYHEKISAGSTPQSSDFFMYYFVLTGLHAFHLVVGMAILMVLFKLSRKPRMSPMQLGFFEGGACFWHMVDLLWIVLFPLIFLVR